MIIVNLYGGPGSGKSTMRADVFRQLKQRGVNCEEVTEFAKVCVWEGRFSALKCQPFIFAQQLYATQMLSESVDVVVTDSPLLLCHYYASLQGRDPESFYTYMRDAAAQFVSMDYFLTRAGQYKTDGRMQNEEEANQVGDDIQAMLDHQGVDYRELVGNDTSAGHIVHWVMQRLDADKRHQY